MPAKLNSSQTLKAFKILGKLIYLAQKGPSDATTYRTTMSGIVDQIATGSSVDANALQQVAVPLVTAVGKIASTLDGIAATARGYIQTYLQNVVAVDMGLPSGTPAATVLSQLVSDMTTNSDSVTASGSGGANSTGVCLYFVTNFNTVLPQSGSPTIPDAWITATPVG